MRDEFDRPFVPAQFGTTGRLPGSAKDRLMVYTPAEPLPKGSPPPRSLRLVLSVYINGVQLASGGHPQLIGTARKATGDGFRFV